MWNFVKRYGFYFLFALTFFIIGYITGYYNSPSNVFIRKVRLLIARKDYNLALGELMKRQKYWDSILEKIDNNMLIGELYKKLGYSAYNKEMWVYATNYLEKAREVFPTDTLILSLLGISYYNISISTPSVMEREVLKEKAKMYLMNAIKNDANFVDVYVVLGMIYMEDGEYKEAIDSFKRALLIEPENVQALFGIARCLYLLGDLEKSLNIYKKLEKILPKNSARYRKVLMNIEMIEKELGK